MSDPESSDCTVSTHTPRVYRRTGATVGNPEDIALGKNVYLPSLPSTFRAWGQRDGDASPKLKGDLPKRELGEPTELMLGVQGCAAATS